MNIPVQGTVLREKAEEIASRLNIPSKAFNGWIGRFRKRVGLSYKILSGVCKSVDVDKTDTWKTNVLSLLLKKL